MLYSKITKSLCELVLVIPDTFSRSNLKKMHKQLFISFHPYFFQLYYRLQVISKIKFKSVVFEVPFQYRDLGSWTQVQCEFTYVQYLSIKKFRLRPPAHEQMHFSWCFVKKKKHFLSEHFEIRKSSVCLLYLYKGCGLKLIIATNDTASNQRSLSSKIKERSVFTPPSDRTEVDFGL